MSEELGLKNMSVRFFVFDDETGDTKEVDELDFISYDGLTEYDRNSIRENGVSQVCLTKMPY